MDHGTAHERIEDLLLDPARLAALQGSTAPEDLALRQHLDGCPACRADLDGWARVQSAVADALTGDAAAMASAIEPMEPPASLRARVVAAARSERAAEAPLAPVAMAGRRRGWLVDSRAGWLGLAAALVVLIISAGLLGDQASRRAAAEADARDLAVALSAVDRMLATDHKVVTLRTQSGVDAGTITWSRHDWVVLTTALPGPTSAQVYRCWLEDAGRSVPVGQMEFAGETAYWVATTDEWQTWEIGPTTRFVVTLEAAGAKGRAGPAVLEASLSSS